MEPLHKELPELELEALHLHDLDVFSGRSERVSLKSTYMQADGHIHT
jgi:hypothetical protein